MERNDACYCRKRGTKVIVLFTRHAVFQTKLRQQLAMPLPMVINLNIKLINRFFSDEAKHGYRGGASQNSSQQHPLLQA